MITSKSLLAYHWLNDDQNHSILQTWRSNTAHPAQLTIPAMAKLTAAINKGHPSVA
ncbi:MAG: hypothetical protein ACR2OA_18515 [Rubripirellula sp.]|jgi:hypothetical protein